MKSRTKHNSVRRSGKAEAAHFAPTLVVRKAPRFTTRAVLSCGSLTFQAAIGRSGISSRKREGDGATPLTNMKLLHGFIRRDRLSAPATPLALRSIRKSMLWCDASGHACYNRPVSAPFSAGHEKLHRDDNLYDLCVVLDWNISARQRNRGSAIFFHLARDGYQPTEGCVALAKRDMKRLLPLMRAGARMIVKR